MNKEIDTGMNMYDFNRVNMGQLPLLETEEQFEGAKLVVKNFLNAKPASYYMLLNHDNRYFTLFHIDFMTEVKKDVVAQDIIECMQNCGFGIIDINEDEGGNALEVWVKDLETETVYMYLFFPYDFGVIEY
jgi:homospermidine synthase